MSREEAWGAARGERAIRRRRTRFGRVDWRATDGLAKPRPVNNGKPSTLTGPGTARWLETESLEGEAREAERPAWRARGVCKS